MVSNGVVCETVTRGDKRQDCVLVSAPEASESVSDEAQCIAEGEDRDERG
jgi:hypothetical protein